MDEFLTQLTQSIPALRRYAYALVRDSSIADDLVQDCLERGLSKRSQWKGHGDLKFWLYKILSNTHLNHYRANKTNPLAHSSEVSEKLSMTSQFENPSNQLDHLYLKDLDRTIALLPEEQKQVLLLITLEGLSYKEVAEIIKIPAGTVMSRLSRARETVRRNMDPSSQNTPSKTQGKTPHIRRIK
ncbi:RNA polymerase sigma factor [Kiloniella antarctica]|uniref:RNA polymerase sigma factor n=1 Tax=Kiloniella antarctica TaxID=1550907 RepID=A0ABW5BLC9_9PROT